jgi:hypothetical protein
MSECFCDDDARLFSRQPCPDSSLLLKRAAPSRMRRGGFADVRINYGQVLDSH